MCLIGVAIGVNEQFPFIFCANRDEFYQRKTKEAHFWKANPFLVAGKDLEKGGTWLGLSASGEIAALTNVRTGELAKPSSVSRGEIISTFFNNRNKFNEMMKEKESFDGFNLLYGNIRELAYTTNQSFADETLKSGIHVLSNATLNTPWPKAKKLAKGMEKLETFSEQHMINYLFEQLSQSEPFADSELPNTGVGLELERMLSPIHIRTDKYGTKCSTVILVDRHGKATFIEKTFGEDEKQVTYEFPLKKF
ncbi:NRDE family protein [Salipaludibacillus daqingensis]|uniref:NRDE family protein n=1 Tax=Salipaludibacillus daqingensis TaxID=3041001 RepID=UPI0024769737|nr:NRDE family protein [Salipaludibacillus daqingensis]